MGLIRRTKVDDTTVAYDAQNRLIVKDRGITKTKLAYEFGGARRGIIGIGAGQSNVLPQSALLWTGESGYTPAWFTDHASTITWPSNTNIYLLPWIPLLDMTITATVVRVSTAGGAGDEMRFALYDSNNLADGISPENINYGYPRRKLHSDIVFATSTAGTKIFTNLSLSVTAGKVYWWAFQSNNGSTTRPVLVSRSSARSQVLYMSTAFTPYYLLAATGVTYGVLPADLGTYILLGATLEPVQILLAYS